jgi:hypothetical protein
MRGVIVALCTAVILAAFAPLANAGWPSYFGPASMGGCGSCYISASTGYNNWTNNRVYRPIGYTFQLGYDNGTAHWSTGNSSSNPFYFPSYGYNYSWCWLGFGDQDKTVNPVTCQTYIP